jgi:hypothetical protein
MKIADFKGTPGPWRWEINLSAKTVSLVGGKPKYDEYVMDFARYGFRNATPRFKTGVNQGLSIMENAEKYAENIPGREHHSKWCQTISHPDAQLIATAPELLETAMHVSEMYAEEIREDYPGRDKIIALRAAIEKALNHQ